MMKIRIKDILYRLKIILICWKYGISKFKINDDLSISVEGDVRLYGCGLFRINEYKIPLTFRYVSGSFYCSQNKLTTLDGCPTSVGVDFHCHNNRLTSLNGCPITVGGNFLCHYNPLGSPNGLLGSGLSGCPETIGGEFYCNNCNLWNFDGLPEFFEQKIDILDNPLGEVYDLFNRDPRCIYWMMEYDVIRGSDIIRDRLEEVFYTLELDIPKNIDFKNYNLIF